MELRLDLRLSQKLVMTPQLQQAIKLLQLSRMELQQVLAQHLSENPLLEDMALEAEEGESGLDEMAGEAAKELQEDTGESEGESREEAKEFPEPLSSEEWDNYYENDWRPGPVEYPSSQDEEFPSYEQTLTKPTSLEEHLLWQLRLSSLGGLERAIGVMLIGNLDEDGYLRTPLMEIAADAQVPEEQVEAVLQQVQTFDPPGVGARSLTECLLIQLRYIEKEPMVANCRMNASTKSALLEAIVKDHLPDLQKKRYGNIVKALNVTIEEVCEAVHVIEGLEPKPGRPYFSDNNQVIVPDVYVFKNEGEWVVVLSEDGLPRLRINPYYRRLMNADMQESDATRAYLDEKLRGAHWIIRSIDQRNKTILKVVRSLVTFQEPFLERGIQFLRPLVLKQVADDVGMHESTISRVTTNKYMHGPQGILELKFFFNAGIQRADRVGEEFSSVTVRELIREMVAGEDAKHPLKDQEIVARLRNRDILIARRTVAKYRTELNIPAANLRKSIS